MERQQHEEKYRETQQLLLPSLSQVLYTRNHSPLDLSSSYLFSLSSLLLSYYSFSFFLRFFSCLTLFYFLRLSFFLYFFLYFFLSIFLPLYFFLYFFLSLFLYFSLSLSFFLYFFISFLHFFPLFPPLFISLFRPFSLFLLSCFLSLFLSLCLIFLVCLPFVCLLCRLLRLLFFSPPSPVFHASLSPSLSSLPLCLPSFFCR